MHESKRRTTKQRTTRLARTDEQLITEYCDFDREDAVNELVRRYLPKVRRIVYPMLLNDALADDVTQEVMMRTVRGLKQFRQDAKFSTWVTRIAVNTTYTFLQRERSTDQSLDLQSSEPTHRHSPEHDAIGQELDEQIHQSLEQLSPKLRTAIVLTSIHGATASEAADIEECNVSTMHWRVHEARKQLRLHLKDYFVESDSKE